MKDFNFINFTPSDSLLEPLVKVGYYKDGSKKPIFTCPNCRSRVDINQKYCTLCLRKLNWKEWDRSLNNLVGGVST